MKKNNLTLVLLLWSVIILTGQSTSDLLVRAVEELPDQMTVVEQSVQVSNLDVLNSSELDYSPVMHKNGIIFTSTRKVEKKGWKKLFQKRYADLFFAPKSETGQFKQPIPLEGKINGRLNEGAATINEAGDMMIFTRNNKNGKNGFGNVELKLYVSKLKEGKWSKGVELPLNCEECTTCHPTLSMDGKKLYFASNRAGGYGGMDIYISEWIDDQWTKPRNLGSQVNTVENEVFPFINYDGTIYYASDGKGGEGGLDIFFNRMNRIGEFIEANNIGKPFNTHSDDFGFYIEKDGLSGLFTSNRLGGKGMDDIYAWVMDQNLEQALDHSPVRFTIVDDETGDRLSNSTVTFVEFEGIQFDIPDAEAPIAFISQVNQSLIEHLGTAYHYQTDQFGTFLHELKHGLNYMMIVDKPNYKTFRKMSNYNRLSGVKDIDISMVHPPVIKQEVVYSNYFNVASIVAPPIEGEIMETPSMDNLETVQIKNQKLSNENSKPESLAIEFTEKGGHAIQKNNSFRAGQRIILNEISYKNNHLDLKESSKRILDETVLMLKDHPTMEIIIMDHTDSRGSWVNNRWLSQKRAEAACNYLISKGIDFQRLTAVGHGEELLLNDCGDGVDCSEMAHRLNQRTEILISKIKASSDAFVNKE